MMYAERDLPRYRDGKDLGWAKGIELSEDRRSEVCGTFYADKRVPIGDGAGCSTRCQSILRSGSGNEPRLDR